MARKAVSFATEPGAVNSSFTTWPKCAMKQTSSQRSTSLLSFPKSVSMESTEKLVEDVYFRFCKLKESDLMRCLDFIIDGHCENVLVAYSVLNTILKGFSILDQEEDLSSINNGFQYLFERHKAQVFLSRACSDLDAYSSSTNVLDSRVLQQIMRAIETLWMRDCVSKPEMNPMLALLAEKCVLLVESRPGSKFLLSPAVRVINIALEESAIQSSTAKRLLVALSRTHFVLAASFSAELIVVLTTMQRVQPSALHENARVWVPLAVRALVSSSSLTRNLALHILVSSESRNRPYIADALLEPSNPQRRDSEILVKLVMRKFLALLTGSQDDIKVVAESWCLVLDSAAQNQGPWSLIDHWAELEHLLFRAAPKSVPLAWESVMSAQKADPSYSRLLLAPFNAFNSVEGTQLSKMFAGILSSVDCTDQYIWEQVLFPIFKCLAPRKGSEVLQSWEELGQRFEFSERNISSYLEIFALLFRSVSSQSIPLCVTLWSRVVKCSAKSRSKAMEVLRFHYRLLSEDPSIVPLSLSVQLTDTLIKIWPFSFSSERPKNSSFSLLTLILLPIVVSIQPAKQGEYLDKLLANCKNEEVLRTMLSALLDTTQTDAENQLKKWAVAAMTIREYIGSSKDSLSGLLCGDALTMFLQISIKQSKVPSAGHWEEWQKLFVAGSTGREKVLARIPFLNAQGLKVLLTIPGYESEKCRIISASLLHAKETPSASSPMMTLLKQSDLSSSLLDNLARNLIARKSIETVRWALALITPSRVFVIAKQMLSLIEQNDLPELVELWNSKIAPSLEKSPAFVPKDLSERILSAKPELIIPASVLISSTEAPGNLFSLIATSSPTPIKRLMPETPPPLSSKRPRRTILTGSMPHSLATPPISSDPPEENIYFLNEELLGSSPPQRSQKISSPSQVKESWRNSQQERAKTLKRVMMGLYMEEAVNDMKRSEQEMIYSLLFRSCVQLRTHLAATGPILPAADVEAATRELELANQKHQSLKLAEETMIEKGRRRASKVDAQEAFSEEEENSAEEENIEVCMPHCSIKVEV